MFITCEELIDFLADYRSGALAAAQRVRFEEHLAVCPGCVDYLDSYEMTLRLGREAVRPSAEPAEVPPELVRAILAAWRGAAPPL
ncbi:MAG: hypothetical protein EYC70_17055 [Planctomycetota bacterium]|nr:MAG: hypothetical protein EYC70_17055 [Planctomycetota bacterium]